MYIYKLGTECDGAQMRASDVYVPTLVALLGLCFDPSECFWDLRVWSGVVGNKSGKLRYMSQIVTGMYRCLAISSHQVCLKHAMEMFKYGPWAENGNHVVVKGAFGLLRLIHHPSKHIKF